MKANRLFIACVATVALAACGGSTELSAPLTGGAEKPSAVVTNASGNAKATIDGESLSVSGTFKDLSTNAVGAHIHGPVGADGTGPVFCHLKVPTATSGEITGDGPSEPKCSTIKLTEAQTADFEGGKMYVNIHTSMHQGGELRGDLKKSE
jgi:hypothetical protein